jgi:hypothetical protein
MGCQKSNPLSAQLITIILARTVQNPNSIQTLKRTTLNFLKQERGTIKLEAQITC